MSLDPERRAALLGAKLGALVRDHWGEAERTPGVFGGGAALVEGDTAWVLADDQPHRVLGGGLAWTRGRDVADLHLLVDDDVAAGIVARRAGAFRSAPTVWRVEGRSVHPAEPAPYAEPPAVPTGADDLVALLEDSGVTVVVEHGVVAGEVLGLEIARVVVGDDDEPRLEVGVGRHDREAFTMIHGRLPTAEALASVVDAVLAQRRPDASPHPLNRLAAERWLRALVIERPEVAGAVSLAPVDPPLPRDNVKDAAPAAALGTDAAGAPVLVVGSAGSDLDLVPTAPDARRGHAPDARLVLVVPERDAHPVTRALAAALVEPAEVVAVAGHWRGDLAPIA